jgi:hypothetical protein
MIDQDEIFYQMGEFISQQGLWDKFIQRLKANGYTDEQIEEIEEG